jgi:RNA polymerase sigma factor (sigma-70 family)
LKRNDVSEAIRDLQTLFDAGTLVGLSDGQLLERFIATREEAPLEVLVERHGPMVWGVCRRVLRDHHDAEDAFQATFLVLARKAASIVPREKVGNWLYGVAYQTALKARATRAKRQMREAHVPDAPEPEAVSHVARADLAELLDRELSRMPEKYRTPIVLCELEGKTHGEAAERLGWPIGTVSGRLSTGRAMLAKRLTRRGVSHAAGALAVLLAQNQATSSASVPSALFSSTVKAATLFAARRAATEGAVSSAVAALAGEVLKNMLISKIKFTMAALLGPTLAGAGLWQAKAWADEKAPADGSFRIAVNEVLNDDSTVVKQIRIEAVPGSTIDVSCDDKRRMNTLTADLGEPNEPNEPSSAQLIVFADHVEMEEGSTSAVKFVIGFKAGKISSGTSKTEPMPADAKVLSDVLNVQIKSGEYTYGQEMKLVTFMGATYSFVVKSPK